MVDALGILAIGLGATCVGMSAMVFYVYALKVKDRRRAVLPWHVVLISFSYALWTLDSIIELERRVGSGELTYHMPLSLAAGVTGLTALVVVLRSLERTQGRTGGDPR